MKLSLKLLNYNQAKLNYLTLCAKITKAEFTKHVSFTLPSIFYSLAERKSEASDLFLVIFL